MSTETPPRPRRGVPAVILVSVAMLAGLGWMLWPGGGSGPDEYQAVTARHTVRLTVGDARTWSIAVDDARGRAASPYSVLVEPVMTHMGHAIAPAAARPQGQGRYRVTLGEQPMAGVWNVSVTINGPGGADRVVIPLLISS
ncbi:FixH family protein [Nonomuraea sp. NPDC046570]|uniref:FixH family protein n=1 Tax=Nonomuraea sp. NPDC046570 TaxID=3155255 RepID=UPI0033D7B138